MPHKILIFHVGRLGDTLASVPALHVIGRAYPGSEMTLLGEMDCNGVLFAKSVLGQSGLVHRYIGFPKPASSRSRLLRYVRIGVLLLQLRRGCYDTLIYLAPSRRRLQQVRRDLHFFKRAGIRAFLGTEGFEPLPPKRPGEPLPDLPHESELLMRRLGVSGVSVPCADSYDFSVNLGHSEGERVQRWLRALPSSEGRPWVAVGPGSNMPAKQWPLQRYTEVLGRLIEQYAVWPVLFGGPDDRSQCEAVVGQLGCGYSAAGHLAIRDAMAAMQQCRFYLGNDTGTMHMAVAAGLKCVAIFSARDYPGKWYPWGRGHHVLRHTVDCESCMLTECIDRRMECLMSITADQVYQACEKYCKTDELNI